MNKHEDKPEKPFKVGQLVKGLISTCEIGLFLVLEIKKHLHFDAWTVVTLCQKTGKKQWHYASALLPVEENNDNT